VLSNRWSVEATQDKQGFTTRIIKGTTIVRAEAVANGDISIDQYRQALFVPPPENFQCGPIKINISSNGTRADWELTDTQTSLGAGRDNPVVEIEGVATGGWSSPIKNIPGSLGAMGKMWGFAKEAMGMLGGGKMPNPGAFAEAAGGMISMVPFTSAGAVIQIWGCYDSEKYQLSNIGMNIIIDRFFPMYLKGELHVTNLSLSQDVVRPYVELRVDFFSNIDVSGESLLLGLIGPVAQVVGTVGQAITKAADQGERIKSYPSWWLQPALPREKWCPGPPVCVCGRCYLCADAA
jgi:hypothetical protein